VSGARPDPARRLADTLAALLADRLPPETFRVTRERSLRGRMAGDPGRVTALELQDGTLVLRLAEFGRGDPPPLAAWVVRRVHDVDISRRRADLPRWLSQLERTLNGLTQRTADAEAATRSTLTHLHHAHGAAADADARRLESSLAAITAQLEGRVPADVRQRVERIASMLRRALAYADGGTHEDTVLRIATDYLPTTVQVYLDLPTDWSDPQDVAGGRRPLDLLREQLAVLERATDEVYQATLANDAARVLANGTFLVDRFGLHETPLDQVAAQPGAQPASGAVLPPALPPALPEAARVAAVFRALDTDRDGHLVRAEMRALMAYLGEPMSDEAAGIFLALADRDGDGRVSEAELISQLAPGDPPPS